MAYPNNKIEHLRKYYFKDLLGSIHYAQWSSYTLEPLKGG